MERAQRHSFDLEMHRLKSGNQGWGDTGLCPPPQQCVVSCLWSVVLNQQTVLCTAPWRWGTGGIGSALGSRVARAGVLVVGFYYRCGGCVAERMRRCEGGGIRLVSLRFDLIATDDIK